MSDFKDMLREALIEDEPYRAETGVEALEHSVQHYRARMRTVRFMGLMLVAGPGLFLVAGAWLYLRAAPLADDVQRLLFAMLALFGLTAVGMGKLWFHGMVAQVQLMRELKALQLAVARLGSSA